jgi:hypothetical protein
MNFKLKVISEAINKEPSASQGGWWLGAVRSWIQSNCINGSSVTWSSNEELRCTRAFTPALVEEIALVAAKAEHQRMKKEFARLLKEHSIEEL